MIDLQNALKGYTAVKRKNFYVSSGLSESRSLNQFKVLKARSSYKNGANRISRRQNLRMTVTSF